MYIPSKRERYGVKHFMLCESETDYLSSIIIYTGSSTNYCHIADNMLLNPWAQYKSPSKVVLSLLKSFFNQGLGILQKKRDYQKHFGTGSQIKETSLRNNFVGTLVLRSNDVTKTKSTKFVSMLSTIHTGKLVDSGKNLEIPKTLYSNQM